jgi:four helix bundle protein
MKNEAGLRPMKRAFGSRRSNIALRFMAATPPLHRSRKASASYSPKANASLTKLKKYDILYLKDGDMMANDKLSEQSMDFAVQIINLVKQIKEQRESIISNQIGRSGTSIGANIREAKYAHGTADFISKMQIALKEANETGYWLELLYKTNYIGEEQYNFLESKCKSLRAMLVSSINTAKNNNK